jgi:hypothetical protein
MRFRFRRPALVVAAALATAASFLVGSAGTAGAVTTGSHVIVIGPSCSGTCFVNTIKNLVPGDLLELQPGTYVVHEVRPVIHPGTPTARIIVRAQDPNNRPLLQGDLRLWAPNYWTLDHLRIQTIDAGYDALDIAGGVGWAVGSTEVWGARQTNALANMSITSDTRPGGTGAPRGFRVQFSCIHDAAASGRAAHTDHNLYVNYHGNSSSGGYINNNIIYGAPNGAGIKLGDGAPTNPGPWGVHVIRNTIAQGGRQILMSGEVRNNTIVGNLLAYSSQGFIASPKTTIIYVNNVTNATNVAGENYGFSASMFNYGATMRYVHDNALRPNPGFNALSSCGGFHTSYPKAAAYGAYGHGSWPVW